MKLYRNLKQTKPILFMESLKGRSSVLKFPWIIRDKPEGDEESYVFCNLRI